MLGVEIAAPPGMEEMSQQLRSMFSQSLAGTRAQSRKLTVKAALARILLEEEAGKLLNEDELKAKALHNCRAERHRVHR